MVKHVRLSAPPPADRSMQRRMQRCRWTAPVDCWAARRRSGPPSARQRARIGRRALPRLIAPQGAHKEGTGAAALCPCHWFLSPPIPLMRGFRGSLALLKAHTRAW